MLLTVASKKLLILKQCVLNDFFLKCSLNVSHGAEVLVTNIWFCRDFISPEGHILTTSLLKTSLSFLHGVIILYIFVGSFFNQVFFK